LVSKILGYLVFAGSTRVRFDSGPFGLSPFGLSPFADRQSEP